MSTNRPTPAPEPHWCRDHSGLLERVRSLENRATSASQERKSIVNEITGLRVAMAKWFGGLAVLVVVVQIGAAVAVKIFGG